MLRVLRGVVVSTAVLLVSNLGQAQQTVQVLEHHVRPAVSSGRAVLAGSLPAERRLSFSFVLPLRNQSELDSLLARLYDASSADYRHFLSVEEFTARFGPTAEDYRAVVEFARASGFNVTGSPANRLVVPVSGTVAQIEESFHVRMNVYRHPTEDRTFFSPDREPTLNLRVPVRHITGLSDYSRPHPMLERAVQGQEIANVTGSGPGGSYLAGDMRAAYYTSTLPGGAAALTGINQTVGLLEFGGYDISNVALSFDGTATSTANGSNYVLSYTPVSGGAAYSIAVNNVLLDGADGGPYGDDGEQVLDIVQAIGMAPGLNQVRVYIGNAGGATDDANIFNAIASENIAKQVSSSWAWIPDDPATDDVFFEEFAAQGQTVFVASGDYGAFDVSISPYFYPAEDTYVTSVGATHLETSGAGGTWESEAAWNSGFYGSGGGVSPDGITIPSWQTGVANTANGGSTTLRNEPDVAMEGDFDNYNCTVGYGCEGGWAGTSFAAPRWAGFMALANQQAQEAGTAPAGGLGAINSALYSIGQGSNYSNDLHDISSENNDTDNQPVWFSAVSGYDLVTGWGSPTGQDLINDLAGPQVPGFWLQSSGAVTVNPGASGSATITVNDAGGFNGGVHLAVTAGLPTGVTASWGTNPTTGTSVLTLAASSSAPNASATLTITGTSGDITETTTQAVIVHGPSFALSANPSGVSVNQSSSITTSITVTPQYGFTGSVTLAASGLPSGVTATWGTNPTSGSSVLTLTASSSAAYFSGPVTITGTSGSLTATTVVTLTVQVPAFTIATQSNIDIGQGASSTAYVYVNGEYGFNGNVSLSVTGLPNGVTASWTQNPTTSTSGLTFAASTTAAIGTSTLTITGTSGTISATTTLTLGVFAQSFTVSAPSLTLGLGAVTTTLVTVTPQYGFMGSVALGVTGLPRGVSASWSPNPTLGYSTLALAAGNSVAVGPATLTITGTCGSLVSTTTMTLTVVVPTFTLNANAGGSIGQGSSGIANINVNPENGFTGTVNLAVSGLPAGVTGSWAPNPTTGYSALTLAASSTAAVGTSTLTVTGTSGSQSASTTMQLTIAAPSFTLSSYGGVTVGQGSSSTAYVNVNPAGGFSGSVNMSVTGLPSGVTASWSPNPTVGNATLKLTANSTAAVGTSTLTITGTSGALSATTTLSLTVAAPSFTVSANNFLLAQGTTGVTNVYASPVNGFSGNVTFSLAGLPKGVTASFSPNPKRERVC